MDYIFVVWLTELLKTSCKSATFSVSDGETNKNTLPLNYVDEKRALKYSANHKPIRGKVSSCQKRVDSQPTCLPRTLDGSLPPCKTSNDIVTGNPPHPLGHRATCQNKTLWGVGCILVVICPPNQGRNTNIRFRGARSNFETK